MRYVLIGAIVVLAVGAGVLLSSPLGRSGMAQAGEHPLLGKPAPDFTLGTHDGKQLTLSDLKGKSGALLVFFATWCPSCMAEVPEVKAFADTARDRGVLVYGVNLQQKPEVVDKFVKDYDINYRILLDREAKAAMAYGVHAIPALFGIDAEGAVRYFGHALPGDRETLLASLAPAPGMVGEREKEGIAMKDESTKKSGAAAVEVPTITRDELRDLMEKDKGVVVVDVLSPESYAQKHIRGAINIPLADMETRLDQLPKKGKVVLYCANFKCKASTAATETLQKHGYDAVDYEGGIADWIEGGLPVN